MTNDFGSPGVVVYAADDADYRVVSCNDVLVKMLGAPDKESVVGTNLDWALDAKHQTKERRQAEMNRPDGEVFYVEFDLALDGVGPVLCRAHFIRQDGRRYLYSEVQQKSLVERINKGHYDTANSDATRIPS